MQTNSLIKFNIHSDEIHRKLGIFSLIKGIYKNLQQTLYITSPFKMGNMISVLPSPLLFSIVLKVLNSGVRQEKEIKYIDWKGRNHNDIIVYVGNSKECVQSLLR